MRLQKNKFGDLEDGMSSKERNVFFFFFSSLLSLRSLTTIEWIPVGTCVYNKKNRGWVDLDKGSDVTYKMETFLERGSQHRRES